MRNPVEFFDKIEPCRPVAMGCDKLAANYLAFIHLRRYAYGFAPISPRPVAPDGSLRVLRRGGRHAGARARHGDSGGLSWQTEASGIRLVTSFRSTSWRQVGR